MNRDVTGSGSSTSRPLSAVSSSTTAAPGTLAPLCCSNLCGGGDVSPGGEHVVDDHDRAAGELDAVGG